MEGPPKNQIFDFLVKNIAMKFFILLNMSDKVVQTRQGWSGNGYRRVEGVG